MKLYIDNINFGYEKSGFKIKNLKCDIEGFTLLLGPNGSGKTTLLKIILGMLKPEKGRIMYDGCDLVKMKHRERAKVISFIPQFYSDIRGFNVYDMIMMGRYPYRKSLIWREKKEDAEKVREVIRKISLRSLENRYFSELSGGEKQKVIIARALAQESKIFLLDEPTAHLDLKNQIEILETLKRIKNNRVILGVFHEPFISLRYADKMILMDRCKIVYQGKPDLNSLFEFYGLSDYTGQM